MTQQTSVARRRAIAVLRMCGVLVALVNCAVASAQPSTDATQTAALSMVQRRLTLYRRQLGNLTAKSLVSTVDGNVFAQNMIYHHSVTMFDHDGNRIADISDRVLRSVVGLPGAGYVRGAPVEGVATKDGHTLFVSNYYLLGRGFAGNVTDRCKPGDHEASLVYQVDVDKRTITTGYRVGATPKFLALTPDEHTLLVANWCDYTLSAIDLKQHTTRSVRVGAYPRGIAIDADGKTAYVTSMGSRGIAVVNLDALTVVRWINPGRGPRHLLMMRDGTLLVTLSRERSVVAIDTVSGVIKGRARTGKDPRSMALSTDQTALFVANYGEDSLAVVRTADMQVTQRIATGPRPIGVAFEPADERVWVSCYAGSVRLYDSRGQAPHPSARTLRDEAKRFPP